MQETVALHHIGGHHGYKLPVIRVQYHQSQQGKPTHACVQAKGERKRGAGGKEFYSRGLLSKNSGCQAQVAVEVEVGKGKRKRYIQRKRLSMSHKKRKENKIKEKRNRYRNHTRRKLDSPCSIPSVTSQDMKGYKGVPCIDRNGPKRKKKEKENLENKKTLSERVPRYHDLAKTLTTPSPPPLTTHRPSWLQTTEHTPSPRINL